MCKCLQHPLSDCLSVCGFIAVCTTCLNEMPSDDDGGGGGDDDE